MSRKRQLDGFRVEHISATTGLYIAYTAPKRGTEREMAESYCRHLERNQCGGRLIDNATGEVIKVWAGKYPAKEGQ